MSSDGVFLSKSRFSLNNLLRKKPVEKSISEETQPRTLNWIDITMYGIAATVGSGIYATVGEVALGRTAAQGGGFIDSTGSAVLYCTAIAGTLSLLTSICYLEFASALPISGSGYAYFYALIGEFLGWFMGWNLTLEYAFAAAAIASKWADTLQQLVRQSEVFGTWTGWETLFCWRPWAAFMASSTEIAESIDPKPESIFRLNFVSAAMIMGMGLVVGRGISMSARVTNVATMLNLTLIFFIITYGWRYVDTGKWSFDLSLAGVTGAMSMNARIFSGAAEMFFCYIGYDTVSTLSADAVNPGRDIPVAAILTIATATVLYGLVGLVLTGMFSHEEMLASAATMKAAPLAQAFLMSKDRFAYVAVSVGSLINMAVTVFACLVGQPKVFAAISRDGLLPRGLSRENRLGVPTGSLFMTIALTAGIAFVMDVYKGLVNMISAGCLFSMAAVCTGMLAARFNTTSAGLKSAGYYLSTGFFAAALATCLCTVNLGLDSWFTIISVVISAVVFAVLVGLFWKYPYQLVSSAAATSSTVQSFVCPLMPFLPCIAIFANCYVFAAISLDQLALFLGWVVAGALIYFSYGMSHSVLGQEIEAVKNFGKI